jgi:Asp-tRNA(Asn)/Glu-tRNA(Gln) amidotransferase A subunit family amidase
VKDQFDQKGADSTMGLAVNAFHPSESDGLLVKMLRDEGAIPFVRYTLFY